MRDNEEIRYNYLEETGKVSTGSSQGNAQAIDRDSDRTCRFFLRASEHFVGLFNNPSENNKKSWERGSGGVRSTSASQVGTSPKVSSPEKSLKPGVSWSSSFLRDLSQVVSRTPWDTAVPFYIRTSQWPLVSPKIFD